MINVNDTFVSNIFGDYVRIGKESVTWGEQFSIEHSGEIIGRRRKCLVFPENGNFKRPNERFVLPHAIGCQSPTDYRDYISILQGCV